MDEYKKPYLILWNGVTDAIEMLEKENCVYAKEMLIKAQQEAEAVFIDYND